MKQRDDYKHLCGLQAILSFGFYTLHPTSISPVERIAE